MVIYECVLMSKKEHFVGEIERVARKARVFILLYSKSYMNI